MRNVAAAFGTIALAGALASGAAAAPVKSVGDPPGTLVHGKTFTVRFVARKRPVFLFSRDGRRGKDVRLTVKKRTFKHGKGSAKLVVPSKLAVGAWRVLACPSFTSHRCAASKHAGGLLPATAPRVTGSGPSGFDLIRDAEQAKTISPAKATLYRVYAAHASPKLPDRYRGSERGATLADDAIGEAAATWSALPSAERTTLKPFFVPPPYKGSAQTVRSKGTSQPPSGTGWHSHAGKLVRVWWQVDPNSAQRTAYDHQYALAVGATVELKIWPRLASLMQRTPVSDAGLAHNGGDGKLDIYVKPLYVPWGVSTLAETVPYDHSCGRGPRWMWVYDVDTPLILAHEFFHTLVAAYSHVNCNEDRFWDEGTANWAGKWLYPSGTDVDSVAADYLNGNDIVYNTNAGGYRGPLEYHDYGSWLFAQFLADAFNPDAIRRTWAKAGSEHILDSIDDASAPVGRFRKLWPKFALASVNREPDPHWKKRFGYTASSVESAEMTRTLQPDGVVVPLRLATAQKSGVMHLASRDFVFDIGSGVRTVTFLNSGPFEDSDPNAKLQAIVKIAGQDPKVEDWSGTPGKAFCLARPSERLEKLTLVFSNAAKKQNIDFASFPPKIVATNLGCKTWTGTIHGTWDSGDGLTETTDTTVTFQDPSPSGIGFLSGGYQGTGTVEWTLSGSRGGCSYSGTASWSVPKNIFNPPLRLGWNDAGAIGVWTSYDGLIQQDSDHPQVTETCPDGRTTGPWFEHLAAWHTEAAGDPAPTVSGDGLALEGEASEQDEETFGGLATWTWSLTSSG